MRNNENGNSRSGRSAAAVRLVLLALIFVTVFAVVLSCGTGTETPLFGSVTDNVAEADKGHGDTTTASSMTVDGVDLGVNATAQDWHDHIHSAGKTKSSYTITLGFSNTDFSQAGYYAWGEGNITWDEGNAGTYGTTGKGTFMAGRAGTGAAAYGAANIAVPTLITQLAAQNYGVNVSWSGTLMAYKGNPMSGNQDNMWGMRLGTAADHGTSSNIGKLDSYLTHNKSAGRETWTTTGSNAIAAQDLGSNTVVTVLIMSGNHGLSTHYLSVTNLTITFTVTVPTDDKAPYISSAVAEDGPQLVTNGGASVTSYLGSNSGLSANTTNITLGKAVGGEATFDANGQKYYKKLTLTVKDRRNGINNNNAVDADPDDAAFYNGVRVLHITEDPGGVVDDWAHVADLPRAGRTMRRRRRLSSFTSMPTELTRYLSKITVVRSAVAITKASPSPSRSAA